MEIRDPIHGSIKVKDEEIAIIEAPFFQRLRSIKQLGFSEYVFPGATHTRYIHSLGVMDIATKVFNQLFKDHTYTSDVKRLRQTVRLACLLHDIGHAPLSHTTEFVMPLLSELNLPENFATDPDRQANHEDYTIKSIVDSSFTSAFREVKEKYGVEPNQIAELIIGHTDNSEYFTLNGVNFFPLLHQLVSSEMDCDRMDYLLRDSYFCGVSYGKFDLDWIIDNLQYCVVDHKAYLAISERAVATFDDFLLCRFHMFLMVYFHYKSVCLEKMLKRYFSSTKEYTIPANIEEYLEHDDHFLMKVLRNSQNEWAQKIVQNQIPQKVFETFSHTQDQQLQELESYLKSKDIDFIKCSSSGRLSKYYASSQDDSNKYPLKVVRISSISGEIVHYQNINEATDLFEKFSRVHDVNRIHCEFENLAPEIRQDILDIIHK
ncbi:MAG: hydrolase [Halobacteriovoraceae bacterium]|nr:hydrolase [Halobacteriovoraceae bacterium]|tara:strand:+ start:3476 stop:4771 length:1296 start_codon:yes stop_codon:yes gene_type:complete